MFRWGLQPEELREFGAVYLEDGRIQWNNKQP